MTQLGSTSAMSKPTATASHLAWALTASNRAPPPSVVPANNSLYFTPDQSLSFLNGSIPERFTILVRARYVEGGTNQRIITGSTIYNQAKFLLGWDDGGVGAANFGTLLAEKSSDYSHLGGTQHSWHTVVGRNSPALPAFSLGPYIHNGVKWSGNEHHSEGGYGNYRLAINGQAGLESDAEVSDIIIYDRWLTDFEVVSLLDKFRSDVADDPVLQQMQLPEIGDSNPIQVYVSAPFAANCQQKCLDTPSCLGLEVREGGLCNIKENLILSTRSASVEDGQVTCYKKKETFQDLGKDTGCTADHEGEESGSVGTEYILFPSSRDLEQGCKGKCMSMGRKCHGYEFSTEQKRCEIWIKPIRSVAEKPGSRCVTQFKSLVDKKFPAFNSVGFIKYRMCVQGQHGHSDCYIGDAPHRVDSMASLFSTVSTSSRKLALDQQRFDMLFGNPDRQKCDPARAGINTWGAGNANARARIGYALNYIDSPCSTEDVDGVIGIGLKEEGLVPGSGQATGAQPYYIGAGWTNGFGSQNAQQGPGQEEVFEATLDVGVWQAKRQCGKGRQCILSKHADPPACSAAGDKCGDHKAEGCSGKTFSCLCFDGYTGEKCEIPPSFRLPSPGMVVYYPSCAFFKQDFMSRGYDYCLDDEGYTLPGVTYAIDWSAIPGKRWGTGFCNCLNVWNVDINYPHLYGFTPSKRCLASDCLDNALKYMGPEVYWPVDQMKYGKVWTRGFGLVGFPLGELPQRLNHPVVTAELLPGLEDCLMRRVCHAKTAAEFYQCYTRGFWGAPGAQYYGPWKGNEFASWCLVAAVRGDVKSVGPLPFDLGRAPYYADVPHDRTKEIMKSIEEADQFANTQFDWTLGYRYKKNFPMTSKTDVEFYQGTTRGNKDIKILFWPMNGRASKERGDGNCDTELSCYLVRATWWGRYSRDRLNKNVEIQLGSSQSVNLDNWRTELILTDWLHFGSNPPAQKPKGDRALSSTIYGHDFVYTNTNRYVHAEDLPKTQKGLKLGRFTTLEVRTNSDSRWKVFIYEFHQKNSAIRLNGDLCIPQDFPTDSGAQAVFVDTFSNYPIDCVPRTTELRFACCSDISRPNFTSYGNNGYIRFNKDPGEDTQNDNGWVYKSSYLGTYEQAQMTCQAQDAALCTLSQLENSYEHRRSAIWRYISGRYYNGGSSEQPNITQYMWLGDTVSCTPTETCIRAKHPLSSARGCRSGKSPYWKAILLKAYLATQPVTACYLVISKCVLTIQ